MTEYKMLTYFKPSFRCIFWILVINPILKGVVSSVVKAVMYPYLYFYKIPIKTVNLSCYCWVSGRAAEPFLGPGSRTPLWSVDPAMREGLRQGPGLEEVLERHLLSLKGDFLVSVVPIFYATPHPLLFWSWERKGRLNYSNLNEVSPCRSAADPACKNGEHLRTQVGGGLLCRLVIFFGPSAAFPNQCGKNSDNVVTLADTETSTDYFKRSSVCFFYMQMPF